MAGKLYGAGVGPGDPELLTLKALRIMKECDMIAVPGEAPRLSVAYNIAKGAYPQIDDKEVIGIWMPMTKDKAVLEEAHKKGVELLEKYLDEGRTVAFLTLGDPAIYSTYMYLHKQIAAHGYEAEIISGIPSFCAAAARLNIGLSEKDEQIHIIPASYQVEEAMNLKGTKILMKAGRNMPNVKGYIRKSHAAAVMVENCGMDNECVYYDVEDIPDQAGYYSLLIVKEQRGEEAK